MTIKTPQDLIPALQQHLQAKNAERDDDNRSPIRLSAAGKCPRKLAYQLHYPDKGEDLSSRALSIFELGDTIHDLDRNLIGEIVPLTNVEDRVHLKVPGVGMVAGHIDGIIEIAGEFYVIDLKSCSAYSFKAMQRDGPREDYIAQLNAYMHATGIHQALLWLYDKNTSHRAILEVKYDPEIVEGIMERFKAVAESTPEALPERMYSPNAEIRKGEPTGREYLGWECVAEGTLVRTYDGWKPIEEVAPEVDDVLTKSGYHSVLETIDSGIKDNMMRVAPYGLRDIYVTEDHELFVAPANSYSGDYRQRAVDNAHWIAAKDIDTTGINYLVMPIDHRRDGAELSDDDLFLLGVFIADGHYARERPDGGFYASGITLHQDSLDIAQRYCELAIDRGATSYHIKVFEDDRADNLRHSLQVRVRGKDFADWLQTYIGGRYSHDKFFRPDIMRMEPDSQQILLHYMMRQDGSIIYMRGSKVENYSTTSAKLAQQVQEFYFRQLKTASIVLQKGTTKDFGYSTSEARDCWHVRHFPEAKSQFGFFKHGVYYARLNKIEPAEPMQCYDLSITHEHNFVTHGGLAHNCGYCSHVGQCWSGDGFRMIIERGRPRWIREPKEEVSQ